LSYRQEVQIVDLPQDTSRWNFGPGTCSRIPLSSMRASPKKPFRNRKSVIDSKGIFRRYANMIAERLLALTPHKTWIPRQTHNPLVPSSTLGGATKEYL
jgi:hypothetical protein